MKTQSLLRTIFGTAFIAVLLSVVSCDAANNPSALAGRWVGVSGNMISERIYCVRCGGIAEYDVVMELLSDGTGAINLKRQREGNPITWKTEKNRFYINFAGSVISTSYKLQGSVLTFTDDNGKITEYTKCKKDCEAAAAEYTKAKVEKAAAALKAKAKKGSFTDSRDGKTYKTVKLDNQTWMAENLNYNANGSKCYENQESNCAKYGRLYNWETAKSACPNGWHLPSDNEWQVLWDSSGARAETMLKASSGWNDDNGKSGNGVDAVGFSALPGGSGHSSGSFSGVGDYGYWWPDTRFDASYAYIADYEFNEGRAVDEILFDIEDGSKNNDEGYYLYSVRCIQD
ncbi:MAG: fibrobacter succinogenes major paralogous domain-containing protein [Fibromonadaceae bacterium]|jgi:uncharacterized protein (TIGR02145 family)|nr:fibrobacter succinogenes major paralogous domain-containing protein [Fibromonadaceae bacterium]